MLSTHMSETEKKLLSEHKVSSTSGHSINKGNAREIFIRNFLENHLSTTVAVGTGEIIDSKSRPNEARNQYDIIIYKANYPKIHLADKINCFLSESVISTIEVKSTLDKKELKQAIKASIKAKLLERNIIRPLSVGYIPPKILNYVVAYSGPMKMQTVYNWLISICNELKICFPILDSSNADSRLNTPSPCLDGIFILGKGFIYFDNAPIGFITDEQRKENPQNKWVVINSKNGLLTLFIMLLQGSNFQAEWFNAIPYLQDVKVELTYLP